MCKNKTKLKLIIQVNKELKAYNEAVSCNQSSQWEAIMREEMSSLIQNKTWDLVPRPKNKFVVDCK